MFIGGDGEDTVSYMDRAPGSVKFTIGGGPVSGAAREHDNIHADVEHVLVP